MGYGFGRNFHKISYAIEMLVAGGGRRALPVAPFPLGACVSAEDHDRTFEANAEGAIAHMSETRGRF
jgi:hypothetical protein